MKESLHLTNATSSLSIACRITGASRSHSHQKIAIQMHARTVNNMRCMWSSGSLHNAAIPPIDLTPCAAKLTEADEARYGCVCIINTLTSVNTLTRNLLLRQLNKSCRHHIIAMMNSWTDGCSPVSIITIRTKNSNKVRVRTTRHFLSHQNAYWQDVGISQRTTQFICWFPKHQLSGINALSTYIKPGIWTNRPY